MENKKEKIKKFIKSNLDSIELTVFYFVYLILVIAAIKDTRSVFLAVSVIFLTVIFAIFTILLFQGASNLKKENKQLKKQCKNLEMKLEILQNEYADLVAENTKKELEKINKNRPKAKTDSFRKQLVRFLTKVKNLMDRKNIPSVDIICMSYYSPDYNIDQIIFKEINGNNFNFTEYIGYEDSYYELYTLEKNAKTIEAVLKEINFKYNSIKFRKDSGS